MFALNWKHFQLTNIFISRDKMIGRLIDDENNN